MDNKRNMDMKSINILLMGKTGNGKSATGNTILRRKAFQTSSSMSSVTEHCVLECSTFDDLLIRVVDTPGLMDTRISNEETLQALFNSMSLCPEGFDALVFVMTYGQRFTNEEKETLDLLKQGFGDTFIKDFCFVIMTKGDNFDADFKGSKNYTFEEWLKKQTEYEFKKLISDCQNRVFLFYNLEHKIKGRHSLKLFLEAVMSREVRYTNEIFDRCSERRNAVVAELKSPTQKRFFQEQLSLFSQNIQTARDSVNKIKSALEDVEVQKNKIQSNLLDLKENIENVIYETEKESYESVMKSDFIAKLKRLLEEVGEIENMSFEEKEEKLADLLEEIRLMKECGSDYVEKVFSVSKQALGASAVAGFCSGFLGLVAGATALDAAAVTTAAAAVATMSAPVLIIGGAGAAAAYYFTSDYLTKKLEGDKN